MAMERVAVFQEKKKRVHSGWVEGARKLPRDSRMSPSLSSDNYLSKSGIDVNIFFEHFSKYISLFIINTHGVLYYVGIYVGIQVIG